LKLIYVPPLVSALVLTYNHERFITSSLKSLAAVDYGNMEIELLDDGSTDRTFALAQEFASSVGSRLHATTQPHSNGRTAENSQKLVQSVRGKYALFMSGDDALAPHFPLASMIAAFEADETLVLGLSRALHYVQSDSSKVISIYSEEFRDLLLSGDPQRVFDEHLCKQVSRLFLQGAVVRADFLKEFGGFDPDLMADDYGFMVRAFDAMRRTGKRFEFFEDSLWLYRIHPSNLHADARRQHQVAMEVVAKYVPASHWADFQWDAGTPDDFAVFRDWCELTILVFGESANRLIIPNAARRFAYKALQRKDLKSLLQLVDWEPTRVTAVTFVLPRVYRLLRF
jgi:glycosyltransferase involved in cell wall biosynthesis